MKSQLTSYLVLVIVICGTDCFAQGAPASDRAAAPKGNSLLHRSLHSGGEPGRASLGEVSFWNVPPPEPRVIRKHDIITIIVREESEFSSEGSTDLKKEAELNGAIEEFIKLNLRQLQINAGGVGDDPPTVRMGADRAFKGEGTVEREDTLTARMPAEVVDVKPNGNIVLQGRKTIRTDEEEQTFLITGICRAQDISADNSILSTNVHDLNFRKDHKGAVRDNTRRGWFTRLLDLANPF